MSTFICLSCMKDHKDQSVPHMAAVIMCLLTRLAFCVLLNNVCFQQMLFPVIYIHSCQLPNR